MESYEILEICRNSMDFYVLSYSFTINFPSTETYGVTSPTRRAVIPKPSNIIESSSRNSTKYFIRFSHISNGLCSEYEPQLGLSVRLCDISESEFPTELIKHIRNC